MYLMAKRKISALRLRTANNSDQFPRQQHSLADKETAHPSRLRQMLRCISPVMAHRVISLRCGIWSLLGHSWGRADIDQAAPIKSPFMSSTSFAEATLSPQERGEGEV